MHAIQHNPTLELQPSQTLDCRGMQCPAPILELSKAARAFGKQPAVLEIIVDDAEFPTDLRAWCRASKNSVLSIVEDEGLFIAHVGLNLRAEEASPSSGPRVATASGPQAAVAPVERPAVQAAPALPAVTRVTVDCRGMQCPAPILAVAKKAQQVAREGGLLDVVATDEQFPTDIKAWCRASKAQIVSIEQMNGEIRAIVAVGNVPPHALVPPPPPEAPAVPLVNVKSVPQHATPPANDVRVKPTIPELPRAAAPVIAMPHAAPPVTAAVPAAALAPMPSVEMLNPAALMMPALAGMAAPGADASTQLVPRENRCTILIIKNDFESLMAAMMCATTAAAQGMETSIFFSFWGVNVLRGERPRPNAKKEKVSVLQKMMQWMMPRGPARQKMSKMHMGGMGKGMMQFFMRRNNVLTLEELMNTAAEQDVKFIVCAMSMGIMGIQKRDIMDLPNIEFAGVATYIELSRRSAMTMVF